MRKHKLTLDEAEMEIQKVSRSFWSVTRYILKYFLVTASLAVVYYIIFSLVVSTDSEKQLRKENLMYRQMYGDMVKKEELIGDVLEGVRQKDNGIFNQLFSSDAPALGTSGIDEMLASSDSIHDKDIVEYATRKLDYLQTASERTEDNFRRVMAVLEKDSSSLPPMSSPIESFSYGRTGASLGKKINPFYKITVDHGGLDMISSMGDPVLAAADGMVTSVDHSSKGYGNVVEISHEGGYLTRYAHLQDTRVSSGQKVKRGDVIGHVGNSGNSFAPHLHYEIQKDSTRLDPVHYFFASATPHDYMQMLFMSANAVQSMD